MESHFPSRLLYAMLVMNRELPNLSATQRTLGLQKYDSHPYYAPKFGRSCPETFDAALRRDRPAALHMNTLNACPQSECDENGLLPVTQMEKELVFDIDVHDFPRFCTCAEKEMCDLCWVHLMGAHLILNHFLTAMLGYRQANLLWVFSGNRGLHCFVNEASVLRLSQSERETLRCMVSHDERTLLRYATALMRYPDFCRAFVDFFAREAIAARSLLSYERCRLHCRTLLQRHYSAVAGIVEVRWHQTQESVARWQALCHCETTHPYEVPPTLLLALSLCQPRIDAGPLKLNHLIKMPFSVHVKSRLLALPVDTDAILENRVRLPLSELKSERGHAMWRDALALFTAWIEQYPKVTW
jgi:hypothetical protein